MKFIKFLNIALTIAVMASGISCKEDKPEVPPEPTLSITPSVKGFVVFSADGATATVDGNEIADRSIAVETNQSWWNAEVTSNTDWLTITKQGNTFRMNAKANTATTPPAAAEITVTAGDATSVKIGVQQLAADFIPVLKVEPAYEAIVFSANGETATYNGASFKPTFTVTSNEAEWDAISDVQWLEAVKEGNAFTLTAVDNPFPNPRETVVTVTGVLADAFRITVTQSGKTIEPPQLSIDPSVSAIAFSANGVSATSGGNPVSTVFDVTTNESAWDAQSSNESWLTVNKSATGFTLKASVNWTDTPRNATVTVSAVSAPTITIQVTQATGLNVDDLSDLMSYTIGNLISGEYYKMLDWSSENLKDAYIRWRTASTSWVIPFNSIWNYAEDRPGWLDLPVTNGKLYKSVELESGTYRFTVYPFYYVLYDDNRFSDIRIVAASGEGLPDLASISTALGSAKFPLPLPSSGFGNWVPLSFEFTVTEKSIVSIGFLVNVDWDMEAYISADTNFKVVELLKAK